MNYEILNETYDIKTEPNHCMNRIGHKSGLPVMLALAAGTGADASHKQTLEQNPCWISIVRCYYDAEKANSAAESM